MDFLPVFLNLRGRVVLIVGGGRVALRKARMMYNAGAKLRIIAPNVLEELADLTSDIHRRPAEVSDLTDDVYLIVLATDDADVQARLQIAARAKRIWCNRCDEPDESDFITGSICDKSPIIAGVISSGCPALSHLLAERIDKVVTPAVVELAKMLLSVRSRVKSEIADADDRAAFWRRWLSEETLSRLDSIGIDQLRQELEENLRDFIKRMGSERLESRR